MDSKTLKKTFKFVCQECGRLFEVEREYCEKCGTQAPRKATKEDYARYTETHTIVNEPGSTLAAKIMIVIGSSGLALVIVGISLSYVGLNQLEIPTFVSTGLTLTIIGAILVGVAVAYIFRNSEDYGCCYFLSR